MIRPIGREDLYQVDRVLISLSKSIQLLYLTIDLTNLMSTYKPNTDPG